MAESNVRDTNNLIQHRLKKGPKFPSTEIYEIAEWLSGLQMKPNSLILPSDKKAHSHLLENKSYRIDCQHGYFEVKGYDHVRWMNIQIQLNIPRDDSGSTTVITTYVHYQGYHYSGMIDSNIILQAMKQQVLKGLREAALFVSISQQGTASLQHIPRSPQSIMERWSSFDQVRREQGDVKWKKNYGNWAAIWAPE